LLIAITMVVSAMSAFAVIPALLAGKIGRMAKAIKKDGLRRH